MKKSAYRLKVELAATPFSPTHAAVLFSLTALAAISLQNPAWVIPAMLGVGLLAWKTLNAYRQPRKWIIQDKQGNWYIHTNDKTVPFTPGSETRLMADYVCIVPAEHSLFGLRRWFVQQQVTDKAHYRALKRALRTSLQSGEEGRAHV